MKLLGVSALLALNAGVDAFPFMASTFNASPLARSSDPRGVEIPSGPLKPRGLQERDASAGGAAAYDPKFPYTGAKVDGLPGTGIGGIRVPAVGDTAHAYQDPPAGAARGPCPGMNVLANHGFIARDGLTTFNELVAAQQNVWNVGWDLAVALATAGVALDGDVLTGKLSIGGDQTERTSPLGLGGLLGREPGLYGHNKFEQDASLTRNDFFLADGDNYSFNGTLFAAMTETVKTTSSASDPLYDFRGLSLYRSQRYEQSKLDNGNFYFSVKAILMYGAASFLYELYPNQDPATGLFLANSAVILPYYGAVPDGKGGYTHVPERIPDNWYNRKTPFTLLGVVAEIAKMYLAYPKAFGGNFGKGNFNSINTGYNGQVGAAGACFFQQALLEDLPGLLEAPVRLPFQIVGFLNDKLGGIFGPFGCPSVSTITGHL